ncbi:MAG: hypothetical protein NTU95_04690 [Methanothrix sp.]|nr:hypothetical protein [Methanothrix sp.]
MLIMRISDIGPSRWYYGLGILIIVIGAAYSVSVLISSFGDLGSGQQFVAPGSSDLFLAESGEYIIFYESRAIFKGKVYSTDKSLPDLNIEVKNKTTGSRAFIYSPLKTTFSLGDRTGESIRAFKIDKPGVYEISASYASGDSSPEVVLAVGKGFSDESKIWNNAMLYLASIILGVGVILLTFIKRQKALIQRKEVESQNPDK